MSNFGMIGSRYSVFFLICMPFYTWERWLHFDQWNTPVTANIKFKNLTTTKRKTAWIKAQWVNETCRDLQAKLIKTAAFCHNRAVQDRFPDSFRLLFPDGSFVPKTYPFSREPDVQRTQRVRAEG